MPKINYVCLETTNYCNLNCSFCNREQVVAAYGKTQHMSLDNWEKILSKLKGENIENIKLTGLGEPFLHPKFHLICQKVKEFFPKTNLIVATNCQYKINDNFKKSLKYIDKMYFSIDGYKETYERDRAPAKWDKLLKFLSDFKNVERFNCNVSVNYVVNSQNVFDIEKIDELVKENKLTELRLNLVQNWNEDEQINVEYPKLMKEHLKRYKKQIKGVAPWTWSDCWWPENGLYVDVFGNVKVCIINTGTESVGNIFLESINEIKNNKKLLEISKSCKENKLHEHCKNCSYKELSPLINELRN
jgi:radical SAM protein with 4Fe4S-binding SPASM domain|tara:strand:+ start:384 stop:1289 length:906 start_codon:yes stop_codon:yes gene_type:complete